MSDYSRKPRTPRQGGAGARNGSQGRNRAGGRTGPRGDSRRSEPRFAGTTKPSQPTRLPMRQEPEAADVHDPDGIRLQKVMASAGVGSRRVCENLIAEGRVQVDGQVVTELGVRIDPRRQAVHVDGVRVNVNEERVYIAFNKPTNVVTTMSDEQGRISVADYLEGREDRLFHVGRLDQDTEGLLLLTNDGELAHRLQHPSYGVTKTYLAQVPGPVPRDLGKRLREGIELEDGPARVDSFRLVDSQPGHAVVELVLHEGRKRIVRRMLETVGHPVEHLVRTEVGPIRLADLRAGRHRHLSKEEVGALYALVGL